MSNTLIIGDTHFPFVHRDYLDFLRDTARQYGCKRICHVGDLVDNHAISFHDHDPNGMSPADELASGRKHTKQLFRLFPKVYSAIGNHDELPERKAYSNGIPRSYVRQIREVYDAPDGWNFDFEHRFENWRLIHGTGSSGHDAAFKSAISGRISTAQGHIHTAAGVKFHASSKDIIWGMQVACGINRKAYAFNYGRDFKDKPILGCGVVLENGRIPMFVPMEM